MPSLILRLARPVAQPARLFSTARRAMLPAGDSFNKKEQAEEAVYIQKQEREKIQALREKLGAQKKSLQDLQDNLDALLKESDKANSKK